MAAPTPEHRSRAVNFLALPRELRQAVLYESFEQALEQDIGFNTNHAILHYLLADFRETCQQPVSAHCIGSWASALATTHEIVRMDLDYVLEKRLQDLETGCATRQQDEHDSPFRSNAHLDPKQRPRGLHSWEVVSSLANFRRWTRSHILYGPWDVYNALPNPMATRDDFENWLMIMEKERFQRKKMLTNMVKDAVCLVDGCRHVSRRYSLVN
ncbi:hypothetical protein FKW77_010250 [Venturia effusa]|uniref:Uncharacterized protein n=1 Tax=Venturia effusa TaxID=50376 RepID=A0A517L4H1_9PEZI|nr:hypothetical protein FKW77_010250 [Venturia effusa]